MLNISIFILILYAVCNIIAMIVRPTEFFTVFKRK